MKHSSTLCGDFLLYMCKECLLEVVREVAIFKPPLKKA